MAIILYKKGNSYTSPKGIRCEFQICNPFSYLHLLDDGWFLTPEEVVKDEKKKKEEKEKEEKEEKEVKKVEEEPIPENKEPTEDELKEDAIREAAKAAGISNWYNTGIEKLVEELETIKEL